MVEAALSSGRSIRAPHRLNPELEAPTPPPDDLVMGSCFALGLRVEGAKFSSVLSFLGSC